MEAEAGSKPTLIVIEGIDLEEADREEIQDLRALAQELAAEGWLSVASTGERISGTPEYLQRHEDQLSVILALEPAGPREGTVGLRALKDHDNPDLSELHVALDPHTLLLVRS